jgi:hypothetical protein
VSTPVLDSFVTLALRLVDVSPPGWAIEMSSKPPRSPEEIRGALLDVAVRPDA